MLLFNSVVHATNQNRYHIDGILPKGPYPPCLRMADRALLTGYPRYLHTECVAPFTSITFYAGWNQSSSHKSNGWAKMYTPNYNYLHWTMQSATNQSLIRILTRIYCADINVSTWRLLEYRNVDDILARPNWNFADVFNTALPLQHGCSLSLFLLSPFANHLSLPLFNHGRKRADMRFGKHNWRNERVCITIT